MKKAFFSFLFILIFSQGFSQKFRSEFEIFKSVFNTEKTNYIDREMALTDEEEKVFWPIYEDYEIDRAKFSGKRWEIHQRYAGNYNEFTEPDAKNYLQDLLRFQKKELKLQTKYFNLLSNKLSPAKAVRFIQLEEYIYTKIKYEILEVLPFVEE